MELAEHYKLFKEPWSLISDDIDITTARKYIQRLCYNTGDCELSPTQVFEELRKSLGDFRLNSLAVDLASITQQRAMAVDAALARLEREKLYLKSLEPRAKTSANNTQFGEIIKGLFNVIMHDSDNAVNLKRLNEFSAEECEYRIMCLTLKLLSTYSSTLPENHALRSFTIKTNKGVIRACDIFKYFTTPTYLADGKDCTSLTYLLQKEPLTEGIYSKRDSIAVCWQSLQSSEAALNFRNSVYSAVKDIIDANSPETNRDLVSCTEIYKELLHLKEQVASHFADINTVTLAGLDEDDSVNIAELQDYLYNDVALTMELFDNEYKTYAVCECTYEEHTKDPMNKQYWQPADDLLYLRYMDTRECTIKPQEYSLIHSVSTSDVRGSLIRPIRCKHCGRIMLPTARFLFQLSLAATNTLITSGGQFTSTTVDKSQGVVMQHTADAIKQKIDDIHRLTSNCIGLTYIDWPVALTLGSKKPLDTFNVFEAGAYKNYFDSLCKSLSNTQSAQATSKLIEDIAVILKGNKNTGYEPIDYLYSLIVAKEDSRFTLQKFITCCRVLYGAEVELANINQAIAAIKSSIYDTCIYDKIDMPFGYPNIKALLTAIVPMDKMLSSLGFGSLAELLAAIKCSCQEYTLTECDTTLNNIIEDTGSDIPEPQNLVEMLSSLQTFYSTLCDIAKSERQYFISALTEKQDITEMLSINEYINTTGLTSSELAILESSAGLGDFWAAIDKACYRKLVADIADRFRDQGFTATAATTNIATTQATKGYTSYEDMLHKLHAEAFGYIAIEDGKDYPDMSCLHQRFYGNPSDIYHKMVTIYARLYSSVIEESSILAEDLAEYAVKIYYECIVSDPISDSNRVHIKNSVEDENYLSLGGFEE